MDGSTTRVTDFKEEITNTVPVCSWFIWIKVCCHECSAWFLDRIKAGDAIPQFCNNCRFPK